jgi:very-short-patch-repair endonuclease
MANSLARYLHRSLTRADSLLWHSVRARQLDGATFRRQRPIGPWIADFCCHEHRLIVEVDGGQHDLAADRARTEDLRRRGYVVVRYWNNEVLQNIEGVLDELRHRIARSQVWR